MIHLAAPQSSWARSPVLKVAGVENGGGAATLLAMPGCTVVVVIGVVLHTRTAQEYLQKPNYKSNGGYTSLFWLRGGLCIQYRSQDTPPCAVLLRKTLSFFNTHLERRVLCVIHIYKTHLESTATF